MCTVTLIATEAGYRLVHSRDEQRTRHAGEPPAVRERGGLRVVSPRDPDGGGTWIAAREDGLTLAIMNVNPAPAGPRGARSRGLIIKHLVGTIRPRDRAEPAGGRGVLEECGALIEGIDPRVYSPFRLVAVVPSPGGPAGLAWTWRGGGGVERCGVSAPAFWATSGLGDSAVLARGPLFDGTVRPDPTPAAQDAFHRHRWPGRGAESVMMSRPDARTVSITAVEAGPAGVRMIYAEIAENAERAAAAPSLGPTEVITLR